MTRTDLAAFAVSSGSAQISVEAGIPLDGGPVSFGMKAPALSGLISYVGKLFEARVYTAALTQANLTSLYNAKSSTFSYPNITGTATPPASPLLLLNPASPNVAEFPSIGKAPYCEVVSDSLLRIHGETSAAVELVYGATQLTLRFKLGAAPAGSDKYVIATFGSAGSWARLYVDASNPTSLYCDGRLVGALANAVTEFNTVTFILTANKVTFAAFEQYFAGRARCFLGSAGPEGLLAADKTVDYDISVMTVTPAQRTQ